MHGGNIILCKGRIGLTTSIVAVALISTDFLISVSSVITFRFDTTSIFICPTHFPMLYFLVVDFMGRELSAMTSTAVFSLTPMTSLERAIFLVARNFRGKEDLVKLNLVEQSVEMITLAHHIMELVHHFSNRLVSFPPKLVLNFQRGYGAFCTGYKIHSYKPVKDRKCCPASWYRNEE